MQSIGLVMMGIGAVLGAAGLFIFWRSSKTSLEQRAYVQSAPSAPSAPSASALRRLDAFVREPAWRGATGNAMIRHDGRPAASFPLLFTHAF